MMDNEIEGCRISESYLQCCDIEELADKLYSTDGDKLNEVYKDKLNQCGEVENSLCKNVDVEATMVPMEQRILEKTLETILDSGSSGANTHVLKNSYENETKTRSELPCNDLLRLIFISGRTEEEAHFMISKLASKPIVNVEQIGLLHEVYKSGLPSHQYRGHVIFGKNSVVYSENVQKYSEEKRPIWFIFSGLGSQWPTMGKSLMVLPKFAESIEKSHEILKSKGVDLKSIIIDEDPNVFSDIINTFVAIAAIQIALVDVLKCIGIQADGFIGHSAGEVGCGYADDCLSSEEAILCAYYWGKSMKEGKGINGEMAAIGLGCKDVKNILPTGVEIGCHNSFKSCTVTGYSKAVNDLVQTVSENGILAQKVNTSNIAIHSFRLYNIMPTLLQNFKTVIKNPKSRSNRWISTSFPESKWSCRNAQLCCAEYLTHTMMNVVHFEEACNHIPSNAITIEIAPHGLLQSILESSLNENTINIPLTNRSHPDNLQFLLESLGRLFAVGVNQNISELYPKIKFPASCRTPMISPLVK